MSSQNLETVGTAQRGEVVAAAQLLIHAPHSDVIGVFRDVESQVSEDVALEVPSLKSNASVCAVF